MLTKDFDIIIFGASGYSAHFVIEELAKASKALNIKWAIAGRNKSKLLKALDISSTHTGLDLNNTPIFVGDAKDAVTLKDILNKTKIIINCVGPYLMYGEPVVKASIESAVDYIDLCGETLVLEKMQLKYNDVAAEAKIYLIGACGWDSIPADLGILYTEKNFNGRIDSIEGYCEFTNNDWTNGTSINYTTFLSALLSLSNSSKLREVRTKLLPDRMPINANNPMPQRPTLFKSVGIPPLAASDTASNVSSSNNDNNDPNHNNVVSSGQTGDGWCLPFPGTDKSVVTRTQYYLWKKEGKPPVSFRPYIKLGSLMYALAMIFFGAIVYVMSKFKQTREIMQKYPQYFTGGMVRVGLAPTRKDLSKTRFRWTFIGKGYSYEKNPELKSDPQSIPNHPPDTTIKSVVTGPDAYKSTAICAIAAAVTLLKERDRLPQPGGVFTTGAAFQNTAIIERLKGNGIDMEILSIENN